MTSFIFTNHQIFVFKMSRGEFWAHRVVSAIRPPMDQRAVTFCAAEEATTPKLSKEWKGATASSSGAVKSNAKPVISQKISILANNMTKNKETKDFFQ